MSSVTVFLTKEQASKVARDEVEHLYKDALLHKEALRAAECIYDYSWFSNFYDEEVAETDNFISACEVILGYYGG